MWKSIANLVLGILIFIFNSDIKNLLGLHIYYLGIPVSFSIVFFLITINSSKNRFINTLLSFLITFGLVYFVFNHNEENFQIAIFIVSLLITGCYVYIQEKLFPEKRGQKSM
jgi:hypothetical protein